MLELKLNDVNLATIIWAQDGVGWKTDLSNDIWFRSHPITHH